MNSTKVIQVRLQPKVKQKAQKKAESLGYTSIQEVVRIFLNSFILGQARPGIVVQEPTEKFPSEEIKLGPKAKKRWEKIIAESEADKKRGEFFLADSPDKAMEYLFGSANL